MIDVSLTGRPLRVYSAPELGWQRRHSGRGSFTRPLGAFSGKIEAVFRVQA